MEVSLCGQFKRKSLLKQPTLRVVHATQQYPVVLSVNSIAVLDLYLALWCTDRQHCHIYQTKKH